MALVVPDACTLPTVEQPLRLAEFDTLFAAAVRAVEPDGPTRTRMRDDGEAVILQIEVPDAYTGVLASLTDRAATVSTGATS